MQIEGDEQRLGIRHVASTGMLNFLGLMGLIGFSCAPFMLVSLFTGNGQDPVNAICGGVTGLFCIVLPIMAARAPRKVDLVLDKQKGQIDATIVRLVGTLRRTIPLSDVAAVRTYTLWGPARVGVQLRLTSGERLAIFDEASFATGKAGAAELAERLSTFLGVPREGN